MQLAFAHGLPPFMACPHFMRLTTIGKFLRLRDRAAASAALAYVAVSPRLLSRRLTLQPKSLGTLLLTFLVGREPSTPASLGAAGRETPDFVRPAPKVKLSLFQSASLLQRPCSDRGRP
jgi:hypothetical protein